VEVILFAGVLHRPVPANVEVHTTLSWSGIRVSYKLLGTMRALRMHDALVARHLNQLREKIDLVHTWPDAALLTLKEASRLGIPTVLERPNAYTRYAYEAVAREAARLGITLPQSNEYAFKANVLEREEEEYRLADFLLCPSDFVLRTFADYGYPPEKLLRHQYGCDSERFHPEMSNRDTKRQFTMLFAGDCAVRKGVHFALEAWLRSPACENGQFLIAGKFLPDYKARLLPMLAHPSVKTLGYRTDLPELMRNSDVFVLPSIEEGSALVTSEARGSGCVLLVSEAAGAICRDGENALVHPVGDVEMLSEHITALYQDRSRLQRLRLASLGTVNEITWDASAQWLVMAYSRATAHRCSKSSV
jgi:glycosyltransferase involved in cell wall biosynthesis